MPVDMSLSSTLEIKPKKNDLSISEPPFLSSFSQRLVRADTSQAAYQFPKIEDLTFKKSFRVISP